MSLFGMWNINGMYVVYKLSYSADNYSRSQGKGLTLLGITTSPVTPQELVNNVKARKPRWELIGWKSVGYLQNRSIGNGPSEVRVKNMHLIHHCSKLILYCVSRSLLIMAGRWLETLSSPTIKKVTIKQAGRRLDSAPSPNFVAMATRVGRTCKSLCAQIARCCHDTRLWIRICLMAASVNRGL